MTPKTAAVSLLEELGITELPIIPKDICQKLNIRYCEDPLIGLDGTLVLDPATGYGVISVNSLIAEQGRKNFTAAH